MEEEVAAWVLPRIFADVTEDIAKAVLERGETEGHLSEPAKKFVECVLGEILR